MTASHRAAPTTLDRLKANRPIAWSIAAAFGALGTLVAQWVA